jgi:hypothetical protein
VLLVQSGGGSGTPEDRTPAAPAPEDQLAVAGATSFDPAGDDGEENEELVGALLDDDPTTTWRTSCYSSPAFGNLKAGVGVVLELDSSAALGALEVVAAAPGWSAQAFVAEEPATDLAGWGEPAGSVEATADAATTIGLDGASGRFVLLWFTALPPTPSPDCGGQPFGVTVAGVTVG